jgi:Xaa-Pro aminopeptidase
VAVPSVLIYADTIRSPELRHEVPAEIMDPFLYAEVDGHRYAVVSQLETQTLNESAPDVEVIGPEQLGWDELVERHPSWDEAAQELVVRACRRMGITEAVAPSTFPLELADRLRAAGIELTADRELFEARRRAKNPDELAGIARAQRAAEAAMGAAAAMLRSAEPADGVVNLDGEPLTSERLKDAMAEAMSSHPVTCEEPIVAPGPQATLGHERGSGPIATGEAVVIDLWPQDTKSGCFADMTRTFVVGEPADEIREWHALCREALDRAVAAIRPGISGRELFEIVCDLFHEHSLPTQLSKPAGETLREGFNHSLGHGVGLEVHEEPSLGRTRGHELVAGDVLAVEPGLYRPDIGGVRLEDLVLVTDTGAETLTRYPYDLEP